MSTFENAQHPSDSVVVVGVFDGVHGGHRALIAQAHDIAQARHLPLVAASFDPHPASVLRPDTFLGLLTLPSQRATLLEQAGADQVVFLQFDDHLRTMSADDFVTSILLEQLHAAVVVVGRNFRYGAKAAGDINTLIEMSHQLDFEVVPVDLVGDRDAWSSTRIRTAIIEGHVKAAGEMLGRPHRLTGEVVHGDHRGRELGYPTANIAVPHELLVPGDGVYSALLEVAGETYPAAVSIGTNPTFDGVIGRRVEAFAIGQSGLDLYGHVANLDFIDFVRPMVAFAGIAELLAAMAHDVQVASEHIVDFLDLQAS